MSAQHNLGNLVGWAISIPIRATYSWTDAIFESSFESQFEPWGLVHKGDRLPYVAPHQVFAAIGLESRRFEAHLSASWVSTMRTVAGTGIPSVDSRMDKHVVFDIAMDYALNDRVQMYISVRNLTDEVYMAARRPAGVRPGLPRTMLIGLQANI